MLFGDPYYRASKQAQHGAKQAQHGAKQAQHDEAGFLPGQVVLIRGEPGSGKTTLALQIASNLVARDGSAAVRFITLEEPEKAMRDRCESYGFSTQR
ncbi:MAG TPA: ATPase domain-containing protein, partial [Ilumatobacteraceae bacterium]|nr:ATPase domain-containing protein [Ilumatobacteraceae bacterium]